MKNIKNQRRVLPAELLEMLDLEERIMLANELHLTPPVKLKDKVFLNNISNFSATTLLSAIVRLRRPFIQMLQDIYHFMEVKEASGRTTTRAVVLPSTRGELRLLFNPALKDVIATTLNSQIVSTSIDSLEKRAREFRNLVISYMEDFHGSFVTEESEISRVWRMMKEANLENQYDPRYRLHKQFISEKFDRRIHAYNPEDFKRVEKFHRELEEILDTLYRVTRGLGENNWLPFQTTNGVLQDIKFALNSVQNKLGYIEEVNEYKEEVNSEVREEIYEDMWEKLLEKMRILKEEIFTACNFQTSATAICDFLNLDIWHERWRIYEIWILTHILQLFENLGFKVDMSARMSNGVWNLKFTNDKYPIALLISDNAILKVYYQLFLKNDSIGNVKRIESGAMPDIAVKKNDNEYLLVLDPKYGLTYNRSELIALAHRYADAFSADLTVIHNFYPMSYAKEVFSKNRRCLILSDIRPDSDALSKLDHDIISVVPDAWLPISDSIVILVDVSQSIQPVQNRITQAVDYELSHCLHHASPDSVLIFFNDKIVKEILLSDVQNTNEAFIKFFVGGTNLAAALEIAIKKLIDMRGPRSLLFFTDGKDSFDIVPLSQKILSAGLRVWIYEAVDSDEATSLQKLAQIIGGQYQRI